MPIMSPEEARTSDRLIIRQRAIASIALDLRKGLLRRCTTSDVNHDRDCLWLWACVQAPFACADISLQRGDGEWQSQNQKSRSLTSRNSSPMRLVSYGARRLF